MEAKKLTENESAADNLRVARAGIDPDFERKGFNPIERRRTDLRKHELFMIENRRNGNV